MLKNLFNADAFYYVIAKTAETRRMTWKQVSDETGVSPSTLTRIRQGSGMDAASMAALSRWSGVNPADFVETDVPAGKQETIAQVTKAFNADTRLSPIAKKQLQNIVSNAYANLVTES